MKKIILSMIGLLAATAFAPQASAVPAFARQTGMGCNACHQQHFPILNSFGRAFKADGFTMMGSQAAIEEEHLSLPSVLNAGILLKAQYRMTNGSEKAYYKLDKERDGTYNADPVLVTTNGGRWVVPDEFGLFFGGRLADTGALKVGTMIEHSMDDIVGFRIPVVVDMGGVKLSAIPFLTDALGPWYGYTESSTGLNRAVRWNEHHADISAHRFVGAATGAASGVTLLAKADMGYLTVTKWADSFPMNDQTLSLNMIHAGFTPTVAGWDMVVTVENISGSAKGIADTSGNLSAVAPVVSSTLSTIDTGMVYDFTGFTVQAHGEIAAMPAGVYVTWANAPASASAAALDRNAYNGSTLFDKSAFTIGADVSVIPHMLHVGAAYRAGSAEGKNNAGTLVAQSDNALSVNMTYDLAQNMAIQITHSMYSGDKYDTTAYNAAGAMNTGTAQTSFLLETAW